jgi:hypothetical protein
MRKRSIAVVMAVCAAVGTLVVLRPGGGPDEARVVLAVSELGELRLARHEFTESARWETAREPAEWAEGVPLARPVVAAFTRNEAVGTVRGRVDAGLDFAKVRVRAGKGATIVDLPEPEVVDCVVQASVLHQRDGLFWRDLDMAGSAERNAGAKFRQAALDAGILAQARSRAEALVRKALEGPVEVRFVGRS